MIFIRIVNTLQIKIEYLLNHIEVKSIVIIERWVNKREIIMKLNLKWWTTYVPMNIRTNWKQKRYLISFNLCSTIFFYEIHKSNNAFTDFVSVLHAWNTYFRFATYWVNIFPVKFLKLISCYFYNFISSRHFNCADPFECRSLAVVQIFYVDFYELFGYFLLYDNDWTE